MSNLFRYLNLLGRSRSRYVQNSKNPELKAKSIVFAVYSIIQSVAACFCGIIAIFLFTVVNSGEFVAILFGVIFGAGFGFAALSLLLTSIFSLIYQLRLNKRAIGYVALAILIIAAVGIGVGAIFIL